MMLALLIAVPLAAGLLALLLGDRAARWLSLAALAVVAVLALSLFGTAGAGRWRADLDVAWIGALGIRFHLAADGLSIVMVALTAVVGLLAVLASWTEISRRVGFFHFNLLWVIAGLIGVFTAIDLLLFYLFWELMLVPMYFLIAIWGHQHRVRAAIKFFLFTQASGLLMLVAIVTLVVLGWRQTGVVSFDYEDLLGLNLPPAVAVWPMLGFFVAFAVKLPAVPLHTWLADAHTEAPTGGSVLLAGLLLKTGAYGLLRFALPLFPQVSQMFAPVAMVLGAAGVLYGAQLAFAQSDFKRLVAYTSVSHLGFVLIGIYAMNPLARQGAVLEMICHGLSTGGLFILVGALDERLHTRNLERMGGLWSAVPRMGAVATVLAMASLGLPGLGNFVAEILILFGTFAGHPALAAVATGGLVLATIYSLRLVQRPFQGAKVIDRPVPDLGLRELAALGPAIAALVWLGIYPQPVFQAVGRALDVLSIGGIS